MMRGVMPAVVCAVAVASQAPGGDVHVSPAGENMTDLAKRITKQNAGGKSKGDGSRKRQEKNPH